MSLSVTKHGPGDSAAAPAAADEAAAKKFTINVNGTNHTVEVDGTMPLLYVLRDYLDLKGPKFGCGLSECGACAVLMDGQQIRSCITPISFIKTKKIITLEGLPATWKPKKPTDGEKLHPLQQAWIDKQVPQCGYCQSGMMIQAADLLSKKPDPTVDEIKQAMNGHLCRCGTYLRIINGIQEAARVMRTQGTYTLAQTSKKG
jgi:aerobic-type carbon monoxide dehydrogenase small subunit (CoxS/CutS family)